MSRVVSTALAGARGALEIGGASWWFSRKERPAVGVAAFDDRATAAPSRAARCFLDLLVVRLAERAQILQSIERTWLGQMARSRDDMIDDARELYAAGDRAQSFVAVERLAAPLAPKRREIKRVCYGCVAWTVSF